MRFRVFSVIVGLLAMCACEFTVALGTAPPSPPAPLSCHPVQVADGVALGRVVLGRATLVPLRVVNCSAGRRTLQSVMLEGGQGSLGLEGLPTATLQGRPVTLDPDETILFTLSFSPTQPGGVVAIITADLDGEPYSVTLTGEGLSRPEIAPRLACAASTAHVDGNLVFSADTNPALPEVVLALHGLSRDQCFEVDGDVSLIGTSLSNLNVLAGLVAVHGSLNIGTALGGNALLTDVDGLANLTRVDGALLVRAAPLLRTVDGLSNLARVGDALTVTENASLVDLKGLQGLGEVGTHVSITHNGRVATLLGLEGLQRVAGNVTVVNNPRLASMDGLHGVERIAGDLTVAFNPRLKQLDALVNLQRVGGYLGINQNATLGNLRGLAELGHTQDLVVTLNDRLETLDGLQALVEARNVTISRNAALRTTAGLSGLVSMEGRLTIDHHAVLETLGLTSLQSVRGSINITNNPQLSTQEALDLVDQTGASGFVSGNGTP